MRTRPLTALLAVTAALLGALVAAAPAHAAEQLVTITADGLSPQVLEVAAGDTVAFVNSSARLGVRAQATTDNWDLESGAALALPGGRYAHPTKITEPGSYGFRVADGEQYVGTVVLRVVAAPAPAGPAPAQPAPPPPATTAQPAAPGQPRPATAPPAAIALPELLPGATAGPLPQTAPLPAPRAVAAGPGLLESPPTLRALGLPSALAAVLAAGVLSLLVRLLLAEPAARRRPPGRSSPSAVATAG